MTTSTVYPVATNNINDPSALTTSFSYTWFPGVLRIQSQTTSLPVVSTAHNGPGTADVEATFYDVYGNPIWSKDPDGYIHYAEYDPGTGAVTKSIADLQTANTSDYNTATLPAGWSTPFNGGLNLVTLYQVDGLGRTTKLTDPNGNITYTVYKDPNHEVRTYPGWQTSTNLPTGPTLITRVDYSHSYEDSTYRSSYIETLTISKAPNVSNGQPDGSETFAMSDVQSLTRSYVSLGGQVYRRDAYFNPSGMTYSTDLYLGTAGSNYYSTLYGYDARGRLYHTIRPTGTITVTDFDGLGRAVDEKVGTSDANLVMTAQYQYDQGGIGDSDLTQETDFPGGSAAARVTQYYYDWRDRLVESKQGVQSSEMDGTHRPILYYQLDNLGHVLTSQQYDGDGVTITSTNGVPNPPSASLLRDQTTTDYDEQGRVYQTNVYSVDQSAGTVSANSLTTNLWYDHRGDVLKTSAPGGLVTKNVTDGGGRVTNVYQTDGAGDSTWNDAGSVVNNNVLSETDTQYDKDGNPILLTDKERFDNETATGALGNPTTSPKARDSYTADYYDAAGRLNDQVDVGTNGGMAYTRPATVPGDSPTVLVTHTAYNAAGLVQSVTDPRGIVTQNTYDLLGRTTQTVQDYTGGPLSNSSDQTTQYTYDGDGHVLTLTALLPGSSETTQYTYGVTTATSGLYSNDLLASVTYPANGQPNTESYTYNALGETTGYTDRNGNTHGYVYDVLGRQTSDQVTTLASGADGSVRRLDTAYDTGDRPYLFTSYADTAGTMVVNQVQRSFNGLGQLTSEAQSHAGAVAMGTPSVQYGYSFVATAGGPNNSRPESITYPNSRVINDNYATGVDNTISRLTSLSDTSATLESYTYLGLDTVVQRSHPQNGVNQTFITPGGNPDGGDKYTGLDRFGRVVEQRWGNTSTNTDDFQYSYDQDSNVLTRTHGLNSSFNEQYSYDNLNRLTTFTRGSHTQSWGLDTVGNWSTFTNDNTNQTRTANAQNQITAISGATTPTYDNNGNTLRDDQNHSLVYDAWNRLVKVTAGSNTETFAYDALGRRIRSTLNSNPPTDLYYSAGWQVVEEDVAGAMTGQYVWSPVYVDAMVERDTTAGQRLYVQQDANWNVTALVDTSGNVQERYAYDPYGKPSILDPTWNARSSSLFSWLYLYQGGRYDLTSGLYNFRNRDLSPTLGRWTEQDPLGNAAGNGNLYGNEDNSPALLTDPTGLWGIAAFERWMDRHVGDPLGQLYNQSPFFHSAVDHAGAVALGVGDVPFIISDGTKAFAGGASDVLNDATGGRTGVYQPTLNSNFWQGLQQARQGGSDTEYILVSMPPFAPVAWAYHLGQDLGQAFQENYHTGSTNGVQKIGGRVAVDLAALLLGRWLLGGGRKGTNQEPCPTGPKNQPGILDRLAAGAQEDVNGLTKAARALEKHGSRPGSAFPRASGNVAAKNLQGQAVLEGILGSNNQRIVPNRFGGQDIFDINTGRGVRYSGNGEMMGFLEP